VQKKWQDHDSLNFDAGIANNLSDSEPNIEKHEFCGHPHWKPKCKRITWNAFAHHHKGKKNAKSHFIPVVGICWQLTAWAVMLRIATGGLPTQKQVFQEQNNSHSRRLKHCLVWRWQCWKNCRNGRTEKHLQWNACWRSACQFSIWNHWCCQACSHSGPMLLNWFVENFSNAEHVLNNTCKEVLEWQQHKAKLVTHCFQPKRTKHSTRVRHLSKQEQEKTKWPSNSKDNEVVWQTRIGHHSHLPSV